MNTVRKIKTDRFPPYRRMSDRVRALSQAVQLAELRHAGPSRRLSLILWLATAMLLANIVLITQLNG